MTRAEAIARARAVYDFAEHDCTDPDCEMTRRLVEALGENALAASTFRAEGAAEERARIVAVLRERAEEHESIAHGVGGALWDAADAIEAGKDGGR